MREVAKHVLNVDEEGKCVTVDAWVTHTSGSSCDCCGQRDIHFSDFTEVVARKVTDRMARVNVAAGATQHKGLALGWIGADNFVVNLWLICGRFECKLGL